MGAGGPPPRALGHVDAAGQDDHRAAEVVAPHQPGPGAHPLVERVVVAAGGPQPGGVVLGRRRGQPLAQRLLAAAGLLHQEGQQRRLAPRRLGLQRRQADLRLLAARALQPQRRLRGPDGLVVEQALVDVADLLDVEGAEAEPPRLRPAGGLDLQPLQGVEQMQHDAVVDGQRVGRRGAPRRAGGAPFEEGEAVGVEEAAAVGRQAQVLVADAAEDGAEGGQQARPGVVAALDDLFGQPVGGGVELGAERADGVGLVVDGVAAQQQAALLGRQQEDEAHHDRQRRFV